MTTTVTEYELSLASASRKVQQLFKRTGREQYAMLKRSELTDDGKTQSADARWLDVGGFRITVTSACHLQ